MRKIVNFCPVNGHNTTFNGLYSGLYQYLQSDSVSDEYLLRYRDIDINKCQNYVEND